MDINVQELKLKLDNQEEFIFLDVREPHEFAEFNIGGRLIPLGNIMTVLEEFADQKEDEMVVVCRSGNRSGVAQQLLQASGFSNVRNLIGGVLAWQEAFGKQRP